MRLINVNTYEIEEFFGSDIPNYIALSHTWLPQEEPSFQDWSNAYRSAKTCADGVVVGMRRIMTELNKVLGYEKIHNFICKSQTLDGTYCWADTVCIDKSSSAELSEAINSMYKIYRNCHHCLVYLADVKAETKHSKDEYSRLVQSRWFTRGWTLQELIAPEDLVFYDKNWRYLGLRNIYLAAIQQTTGISTDVLVGTTNLKSYSIAERMSWASKRTTTREEDLAYCLLGILDINMPLLYGEGEKAFQRLQEEIIKKYDDDSVFVWSCSSASSSTYRGILARSPSEFANSRGISFFGSRYSEPYSMTNQGLRAQFYGWSVPGVPDEFEVVLNCRNDAQKNVTIRLRRISPSLPFYARVDSHHSHITNLPQQRAIKIEIRNVYVREEICLTTSHRSSRARGVCFQLTPRGLFVKNTWRLVSREHWQCEQPFQYPTHQRWAGLMFTFPEDSDIRHRHKVSDTTSDKPIFCIMAALQHRATRRYYAMRIEFGLEEWCSWDEDELSSLWARVRLGDVQQPYDPSLSTPTIISDTERMVQLSPALMNDDLWLSTAVPYSMENGHIGVI